MFDFSSSFFDIAKERGLLIPLDLALVGATGVGKSTTINCLFGSNAATVGNGVEPETKVISSYNVSKYFRIHDTAGLGDGRYEDNIYAKDLSLLLSKKVKISDSDTWFGFIDMVLVILDGGTRDLGTTFKLLDNVILNCIEPDRVIVAINQADQAMKGRHWDYARNKPDVDLLSFLEEKSRSVQRRILDSTGLFIKPPVFYSAYHEYNITTLQKQVLSQIPNSRRT